MTVISDSLAVRKTGERAFVVATSDGTPVLDVNTRARAAYLRGRLRVGTPGSPHPGAALDLRQAPGAALLPHLTTAQRDALLPAEGMLIYNLTSGRVERYQGGTWGALGAVTVRKNSGANVGSRPRLNFIEGANVTLTVQDDPTDDEVDIVIAASGGGGSGGHVIRENGVDLPNRSYLNFAAGLVASDDATNNETDVAADYGASADIAAVGTAASAGTLDRLARADHVHPHPAGPSFLPDAHHSENHQARHQAGGADALGGLLDANARVAVRRNSGANVGTRRRLNLVEGTAVTLTVSDDAANEEVAVTVAAEILRGTLAARPAAGKGGRLYYATDEGVLYRDSGTAWEVYSDALHALTWTFSGALQVTTGKARLRPPRGGVVLYARCSAGTAPAGQDILVDINLNGTTIFTTQANRPKVPAGSNDGPNATPDVTSFAAGDVFTCDVDQVGSTTAGADLVVTLVWVGV